MIRVRKYIHSRLKTDDSMEESSTTHRIITCLDLPLGTLPPSLTLLPRQLIALGFVSTTSNIFTQIVCGQGLACILVQVSEY